MLWVPAFLELAPIFQEPSECRAKDFLAVVFDNGPVANDDLIEVPIKYPLHRRAHASAICNGRPIKTRKSATGKGPITSEPIILVIQASFSLRLNKKSATMSDRLRR